MDADSIKVTDMDTTDDTENLLQDDVVLTAGDILSEIISDFDEESGDLPEWDEGVDPPVCFTCNTDKNVGCVECGQAWLDCECEDGGGDEWYCTTCGEIWSQVVWSYTFDEENGPDNLDDLGESEVEKSSTTVVKKEWKCVCTPEKGFFCGDCKVRRDKKTDPWREDKIDSTKTSTTTYASKCRHYAKPVIFPNGTVIHASSCHVRKEGEQRPDLGVYLDGSWKPCCFAWYLAWADYGLPGFDDIAIATLVSAVDHARQGKMVEVGCIGGHGRTGTALAAMATVCGVEPKNAVKWVRENYCHEAVETEQQEWWPLYFHATLNGYKAPKKPEKKAYSYSGASFPGFGGYTASKTSSTSHTTCPELEHYLMALLGLESCSCSWGKKDIVKALSGTLPYNHAVADSFVEWRNNNRKNKASKNPPDRSVVKEWHAAIIKQSQCHCGNFFDGKNSCACTEKDITKCKQEDCQNRLIDVAGDASKLLQVSAEFDAFRKKMLEKALDKANKLEAEAEKKKEEKKKAESGEQLQLGTGNDTGNKDVSINTTYCDLCAVSTESHFGKHDSMVAAGLVQYYGDNQVRWTTESIDIKDLIDDWNLLDEIMKRLFTPGWAVEERITSKYDIPCPGYVTPKIRCGYRLFPFTSECPNCKTNFSEKFYTNIYVQALGLQAGTMVAGRIFVSEPAGWVGPQVWKSMQEKVAASQSRLGRKNQETSKKVPTTT